MRRLRWGLDNSALAAAVAALRPYRGGPINEPLGELFERLKKQIGAQEVYEDTLGDDEDLVDGDWRPAPLALRQLLEDGVTLLGTPAANAKWDALVSLVEEAGSERVVFFAQPVETVSVVARYLEQKFGERPSIIIGNQSEDERRAQVAAFQRDGGPQFLVSSRAGGEGLNMQRARRLVHLDVPWNPMELEQRIGRVHRFGSRQTIIVDTIVAAGSREVEMYKAAREKLQLIARQLDPEQFDLLFSRVMALVPPKELEDILGATHAHQMEHTTDEIGRLVSRGYDAWQEFDDAYRANAERIQALSSGQATWEDLEKFLIRYGGADKGPSAVGTSFTFEENEIVAVEEQFSTVRLAGTIYACGETGGVRPSTITGEPLDPLGLNVPDVTQALRRAFFPDRLVGAAYVARPVNIPADIPVGPVGLLMFLRQSLRFSGERPIEERLTFHVYLSKSAETKPEQLDRKIAADILRCIWEATRVREPQITGIENALMDEELQLVDQLRRPSETDLVERIRHVVWPIGTIIVA